MRIPKVGGALGNRRTGGSVDTRHEARREI